MPRRLTQKELESILSENGFSFIRQAGSHRVWRSESRTVIVPAHGKNLAVGTLLAIIRQSGLDRSLFQ
jgi:predicted RNA binding protein YcfA (HicA-like mRNA interferase family)